jgi:hypothetical protein
MQGADQQPAALHTNQHSPGSSNTDMLFRHKIDANVQRMLTDDEYVFTYVAMATSHKWLGGKGRVRFYHLAGVLGVVRRLRERVQAQEQRIAALEARLTALEQQVGR